TAPAFVADPLAAAAAYNDGNPAPDAGGYPYAEAVYAAEPGARVVRSAAPGYEWREDGGRNIHQGFRFASALSLPGDLDEIANPPSTETGERDYRIDWSLDEDSMLVLS